MGEGNFDLVGPKIIVIGIGGAGNNAVNRMIDEVDESQPIEFYVMNTDKQSLLGSKVPTNHRIVLGEELTHGLGAGGDPKVGEKAAEASSETIRNIVRGANLVFIAAGMGGGTGTGASPVIARICAEEKALTIAIVTRPFGFEGKNRVVNASEGYNKIKQEVDSIIVVSNDKLLMNSGSVDISTAFQESDRVLSQSVKTITDLITIPGIINLDFADISKTLQKSGLALIGFGMGEGQNRSIDAASAAISSPLIDTQIAGARRMICSVTCGPKVTLYEAQSCVNRIAEQAGNMVDIKLGIAINDQLTDQIIVSVIATDFPDGYTIDTDPQIVNASNKDNADLANNLDDDTSNKDRNDEEDILPDFLKNKNID